MSQHKKILFVDDKEEKRELFTAYLSDESFQVTTANNGQEALNLLEEVDPDLILLDVQMPVMDGKETCRQIRQRPRYHHGGCKRIILFSEKHIEMIDVVGGLDLGADRYLVRPIAPRLLLAEIEAILRTIPAGCEQASTPTIRSSSVIEVDKNLIIHVDEGKLVLRGRTKFPQEQSFRLLVYLAQNLGKPCKERAIKEHLHCSDVAAAISRLRDEIEIESGNPRYVLTIRSRGYMIDNPAHR